MRISDIDVFDIVILIFKIFIAIGIVGFIFSLFVGLNIFFSKTVPSFFIFITKCFSAIGFQSTWWNLIPFLALCFFGFAAILSYIWPQPNAWLWWGYATPGILIFGITLALNIYLKPKSIIQNKVDSEKLKKWREYK